MKAEWGGNFGPPVTFFETYEQILIKFGILALEFRIVV
jgi:hypothetical protein